MFDTMHLKEILVHYKKQFSKEHWEKEKYKWEAITCFQENWDLEAEDMADMLTKSLKKTANLLASANYFPAKMIQNFAKSAPSEVRSMFTALFDESKDVYQRMEQFKKKSAFLFKQYYEGAEQHSHFQDENAISTYLWLRYPDTYYIYKWSESKSASEELGSDYSFKKGDYEDNIRNFLAFYDEICQELQKDTELVTQLQSKLTDRCYADNKLHTLTMDVVFYIGRKYRVRETDALPEEWWLTDRGELSLMPDTVERIETKAKEKDVSIPYSEEEFLHEVYLPEKSCKRLLALWKRKKNLILQGAPGVGKTFAGKRLAYLMMGEKDESRIQCVQFHQSYSYEDFVMGYRPVAEGFALKEGVFYQFCKKAKEHPQKEYFFLIDEINRGNISKIFGELLMLIEAQYRGQAMTLAYTGETFFVPSNVYLLGMMNTADRSLAMMDYALRRRFSFFDMEPAFDSKGFLQYQKQLANANFDRLIVQIKALNQDIMADPSLGKGFCIGHSYVCGASSGAGSSADMETCTDEWMQDIIEYDILPMLREYWFDNENKVKQWEKALCACIKETTLKR